MGNGGATQEYATQEELWQETKDGDGTHSSWYQRSVEYWDSQEASYDGVLGGYGHVSDYDIADSSALLKKAFRTHLQEAAEAGRKLRAIDCGAGVGRITEQLLLRHFAQVDLLEPSHHLLEDARRRLTAPSVARVFPPGHRAAEFLCQGLQDFVPQPGRYDCVWIQWVMLYLTDQDVLSLFHRCRKGLSPDGLIVVKENICRSGFVVDKGDSSLTRSNNYMLDLMNKAHMKVLYNVKQKNFPRELFEVRLYVLQPKDLCDAS